MSRFGSHDEFIGYLDGRYEHVFSPVLLDIEEATQGTREGASSWSSTEHISSMASASGLNPGERFLEIGCGTGWSAIRIAKETGARPVLTDLPANALTLAMEWATQHGVMADLAQADATQLPFVDGSFDAITHSDVLCCLPGKDQAIEQCARVLKPGKRMVFGVIHVADGASHAEVRRRLEGGPDYIMSDDSYSIMLTRAGFEVDVVDWTADYRDRAWRLKRARADRLSDLTEIFGADEAVELVERAQWNIEAIDDDLLRRSFFVATRI